MLNLLVVVVVAMHTFKGTLNEYPTTHTKDLCVAVFRYFFLFSLSLFPFFFSSHSQFDLDAKTGPPITG